MSDSHSPIDPAIAELHARVWTGQASADDVQRYAAWRGAHPDHAVLSERLNDIWHAAGRRPDVSIDVRDRVWRAIEARNGSDAQVTTPASQHHARLAIRTPLGSARQFETEPARRRMWWSVAAGAVAAGLAWIGVTTGVLTATHRSTTHHYASPAGQRAHVTLADGSRVTLGPASSISVTTGDANAGTSVVVRGEALFEVAHVPNRSFTVRAGRAVARVLGTTFVVRRYDTDRSAQIVVTDGKVAVAQDRSSRATPVTLAAGMLGLVPDSGDVTVMPHINADTYTSLTSDRLVFNVAPVPDIVRELSRAYGVDIKITDTALAHHTLTITIPVDRWSVDTAMSLLTEALNATFDRDGRVITITPGRRAQPRNPRAPLSPLTSESTYGR